MEDLEQPQTADTRSLHDVLAELRDGDYSQARVARLSDLSREDGRILARAWPSFSEQTREAIVRRIDELSEERFDVNFRRIVLCSNIPHSIINSPTNGLHRMRRRERQVARRFGMIRNGQRPADGTDRLG